MPGPATLIALDLASTLVSAGIQSLLSAQKYNQVIARAHAENRDVTDAELADVRAESQRATDEVMRLLNPGG